MEGGSSSEGEGEYYLKERNVWNENEYSDGEEEPKEVVSLPKKILQVSKSCEDFWKSMQDDDMIKCCFDREGVFLITFDGCYRENREGGGFGAMLWSGGNNGGPLAAVAGYDTYASSTLLCTLEGLIKGLQLAGSFPNIKSVMLVCNSDRISEALSECFITNAQGGCSRRHPPPPPKAGIGFGLHCIPCFKSNMTEDDDRYFLQVNEAMNNVLAEGIRYYRRSPWIKSYGKEWNKPADYLAKLCTNYSKRELRTFEPSQFPEGLKELVAEFGGQSPFNIE